MPYNTDEFDALPVWETVLGSPMRSRWFARVTPLSCVNWQTSERCSAYIERYQNQPSWRFDPIRLQQALRRLFQTPSR